MKGISLIILVVSFISCNSNGNKENPDSQNLPESVAHKNNVDTVKKNPPLDGRVNVQQGNTINIAFAQNKNSISVDGHLDSIGASVICYLAATGGQKLKAEIEPKKNPANIRFNQIIFPDKKSDGPFGQQLEYDLTQKGSYQLIIGPSLMAENPYKGDFRLHIAVK
jgi:hypothetical protein